MSGQLQQGAGLQLQETEQAQLNATNMEKITTYQIVIIIFAIAWPIVWSFIYKKDKKK